MRKSCSAGSSLTSTQRACWRWLRGLVGGGTCPGASHIKDKCRENCDRKRKVNFQGTVLDKENAFREWDKLTILVFLVVSRRNSFKRVLRFCWGAIFRVRSAGTMEARGRNLPLWPRCRYEKRQSSINIKTPTDRIMSWWVWLGRIGDNTQSSPSSSNRSSLLRQTSVCFNNGLPRSL